MRLNVKFHSAVRGKPCVCYASAAVSARFFVKRVNVKSRFQFAVFIGEKTVVPGARKLALAIFKYGVFCPFNEIFHGAFACGKANRILARVETVDRIIQIVHAVMLYYRGRFVPAPFRVERSFPRRVGRGEFYRFALDDKRFGVEFNSVQLACVNAVYYVFAAIARII